MSPNNPNTDSLTKNAAGTPLLSVRNLRVSFHQPRSKKVTTVVNDFAVDIADKGAVAIVGESGSGKTVSMRALLGVLPETAEVTGEAIWQGDQNLVGMPDSRLRRIRGSGIGMVFQNAMSALNPTRTLKVQLTEHLRWHGVTNRKEAVQRAIEALDRVGIPNPAQRIKMFPFQLSGGQRQRAMIAMAIVANPSLLIADEPTTALDVTVQRQVLDLLRDLRSNDGMGLVMITHDLGVAKYMCDEIVVMRHGDIVETGTMSAFIANPEHAYSQQLLDAALDITAPDDRPEGDSSTEVSDTTVDSHETEAAEVASDARTLLAADDLDKIFSGRGGEVHAVNDVSLTINKGETVGVVGESGSGKSTLARLLTRLIEPTDGEVTYDSTNVLDLSGKPLKDWRRKVQMVFQNPYGSLLPHLTVAANVIEPLRVHEVGTVATRRERAIELLTQVGIDPERVDHYPRQFSGGQQQRVAVARALALEPELLVCDEPTSALDVSIQAQILELLQQLQDDLGVSMLFITHNLAVAQKLCDRTIVMSKGYIVEAGPTEQLFRQPVHAYTKSLLAAVLPIHHDPVASPDHDPDAPSINIDGELTEVSPGHWVRIAGEKDTIDAAA